MEEIRNYLETMFAGLPNTPQVMRAKNELWQMMEDKYTELKESGSSDREAIGTVISEFGNLDEIADELGIRDYISAGGSTNTNWGQSQDTAAQANWGQSQDTAAQANWGRSQNTAFQGDWNLAQKEAGKNNNTWVIALVIVVIGCAAVFSVFSLAKRLVRGAEKTGDFFESLTEWNQSLDTVSGGQLIQSAADIEINVKVVDLVIEPGEEYKISYECPEKYCPVIEEKDGVLTVEQTKGAVKKNTMGEITITVPEGTNLERLHIDANVGDVDIKGINATDFSISQNVGDIGISGCEFAATDVSENIGDIDLEDSALGESEVENNIGDISCKKVTFTGMEVSNSMGDIAVACQEGLYDTKISTSLGEVYINGKSEGRKYSDESGDIKVRLYNNLGDIHFGTNE